MFLKLNAYKNRENGFTLIELLIVVLIIGILAAIAIPVYLGVQNQAHKNAVKLDVNNTVKRVQVALTEGAQISAIKANNSGYTQVSEVGETVTITDSTSTPSTNQFSVTGVESTSGTPKGAIDYTYAYDSATGKFTETNGSGDLALGGSSGSSSAPTSSTIGAQPAFTSNNYGNVYTLATSGLDNASIGNYSNQLAVYGSTVYVPCYNASYVPTKLCKITGNSLTTLAGSNTSSIVDGPGTSASFVRINAIRVDAAGNVYVLDFSNAAFVVRKYDPTTNNVTTIGTISSPVPLYSNVADMTLTADGNINVMYIAKTTTQLTIVQLSATGTTTPLYTGTLGGVANGFDIYTNSAGATFVWNNKRLYKLTGQTTLTQLTSTQFASTTGDNMTGDNNGNLYLTASTANSNSQYILYKVSQSTGTVTTMNTATASCARTSSSVALGTSCLGAYQSLTLGTDGNLYFMDYGNTNPTGPWLRYIGV